MTLGDTSTEEGWWQEFLNERKRKASTLPGSHGWQQFMFVAFAPYLPIKARWFQKGAVDLIKIFEVLLQRGLKKSTLRMREAVPLLFACRFPPNKTIAHADKKKRTQRVKIFSVMHKTSLACRIEYHFFFTFRGRISKCRQLEIETSLDQRQFTGAIIMIK